MRCHLCKYCSYPNTYYYADGPEPKPPTYKCTRRAPIATGGMMSPAWTMWPAVKAVDCCGDFEPSQQKDEAHG